MENDIKKILVIRLSALGDTIHTLPSVYALKKRFPNAQIDWVVEDKASKFVEDNPLVNKIYVINRKNRYGSEFIKLIRELRREKYDVALDFQQLFKSGIILGLCGAKRRITLDCGREFSFVFANEIVKTGRKLFDINYHVVNRNLDLVKALGCDSQEIKFVFPDLEYSNEIKEAINSLDKMKKTIVLAPATTWRNKHWSVNGWRDLINEFKNDYNIVLTATQKEKMVTQSILEGIECDNILDLTGKTTLNDLVYVYQHSDCVVSPDSGSAHTAWMSGAKAIVTLFFATSANRTAPFGLNYCSISANVPCSPCMKKKCRLNTDCEKCIASVTSQETISIVKKVLQD